MKTQLIQIFNALKTIETRGDSTVVMADCLRAIADLANSLPDKSEQEVNNDEH